MTAVERLKARLAEWDAIPEERMSVSSITLIVVATTELALAVQELRESECAREILEAGNWRLREGGEAHDQSGHA